MNTETALSNDTIEQLRKLLGSFNNFERQIDMYTLCINKTLIKKSES